MTPETRANIVRRLRAHADWIEQGGNPDCYAHGCGVSDLRLDSDEARSYIDLEPPSGFDEWDEGAESQEWGVCVPIEEVQIKAHRADLRGRFTHVFELELVDPDARTPPKILEQECPNCYHTVFVPPGQTCPHCTEQPEEDNVGPKIQVDIWRPTPEDPGTPLTSMTALKPLAINNLRKTLVFNR